MTHNFIFECTDYSNIIILILIIKQETVILVVRAWAVKIREVCHREYCAHRIFRECR